LLDKYGKPAGRADAIKFRCTACGVVMQLSGTTSKKNVERGIHKLKLSNATRHAAECHASAAPRASERTQTTLTFLSQSTFCEMTVAMFTQTGLPPSLLDNAAFRAWAAYGRDDR